MSPSRAHGERGERPRVLVLTSTFPRWKGDSTPRFVLDLAMLASRRAQVTVLAPGAPGALSRESWEGIDVRRFSYFVPRRLQRLCYDGGILPNVRASWLACAQAPLFALSQAASLRRIVSKFDLVHAHWMVPQGIVAAVASAHVPVMLSIHGSDLFALRGPVFSMAQGIALRRATVVTVNSEAARVALRRRHPTLPSVSSAELLPMGFDETVFVPPHEGARDPKLVACVGRLSAQKGIDVVLEAMARVRITMPAARLVIAGDGPLASELAARAQVLFSGDSGAVAFTGGLGRREVAALLRKASVFVAASREGEGQGLAVIEAMACGCPVVTTDSGALAALVGENARGLVVPIGDSERLAHAIASALSDSGAARARAEWARDHVRAHYTWASIAPRLFACYARAHSVAGTSAWA